METGIFFLMRGNEKGKDEMNREKEQGVGRTETTEKRYV